jgi:hypothetical protein
MCAACILLKLLNANITIFTMPRFSSKLQGEFSLKPVGFGCFDRGIRIFWLAKKLTMFGLWFINR